MEQDQVVRLFITGGAGTGKSFLLKLIREHLLRHNKGTYPNVLVAAPTGLAAYNIKGWTLHRLLHLDVQNKKNAMYHQLFQRMLHKLRTLFCNVSVLIIDEISMVSTNTLIHKHRRLQEIKDTNTCTDPFFGNLHILAFGDILQLPPVFGSPFYASHTDLPLVHLWKDLFHCIELTQNVRQKGDIAYATMLNRIRTGKHTNRDIKFLKSKHVPKTKPLNTQHIFPTKELCRVPLRDFKNKVYLPTKTYSNSMLLMRVMVTLMMMMTYVMVLLKSLNYALEHKSCFCVLLKQVLA